MIGGLILASDEQKIEFVADRHRDRFILGFGVCFILAVPANYYSNIVFSSILAYGGWGTGHQGSISILIFGRVVSWMMMGTMLGAGVGIAGFFGSAIPFIRSLVGSINFPADQHHQRRGRRMDRRRRRRTDFRHHQSGHRRRTRVATDRPQPHRIGDRTVDRVGSGADQGRMADGRCGTPERSAISPRRRGLLDRPRRGKSGRDCSATARCRRAMRSSSVAATTTCCAASRSRTALSSMASASRARRCTTAIASVSARMRLSFHLRGVKPSMRVGAGPSQTLRCSHRSPLSGGAVLIDATGRSFPNTVCARKPKSGAPLTTTSCLDDASVSRHHAAIEARNGGFQMRDLGSQNGTFVRGERVSEAPLKNGDPVRVGDASFTFRA